MKNVGAISKMMGAEGLICFSIVSFNLSEYFPLRIRPDFPNRPGGLKY